jgi:oligosaccharide translocation protein RFT1
LTIILRFYGIMSLLAFAVGPTAAPEILSALIGTRRMTPKVRSLLSVYCYYIPFLAFNGITEAFVASTADSSDLRLQAAWTAVFSFCYAALSFVLLQIGGLGAFGLVIANIVNMFLRTLWSYMFIKKYLRRHQCDLRLADISPGLTTFGSCALAISIMSALDRPRNDSWTERIKILGVAVVCSVLM